MQIIAAITRRVKSPLSTKAWKTIPWDIHEKCIKDKLLDIMNEIPWILEQQDHMKKLADAQCATHWLHLLRQCKRQVAALNIWRRTSETDAVVSRFDERGADSTLPSPKDEVEVAGLHLTGLYWVTALLLNTTLWSVSKAVSVLHSGSEHQTDSTLYEQEARHYAKKMASSVHLWFEKSSSDFERSVGLFPLIIASQLFQRIKAAPEEQKARNAIDHLVKNILPGTYAARILAQKLPELVHTEIAFTPVSRLNDNSQ